MSTTFSRWRKVELLDLAEKLHIEGLPSSIRKNDLIGIIESHLAKLAEPLDVDVEYPELKSFYDSIIKSMEESSASDAETESQVDELENGLPLESVAEAVLDAAAKDYNGLGFGLESDSQTETDAEAMAEAEAGDEAEDELDEAQSFRFDFQNYLSDIKDNVVSLNESAQDMLSTTRTIEAIFGSIELYYITKPLIALQDRELSTTTLITWATFSYFVPMLFGYYINFCRYDFTITIDPMIYYLTKSLLSLTILNLNLESFFSSLPEKLVELPLSSYVQVGLQSWQDSLGQLPLIFAVVGVILTLYII